MTQRHGTMMRSDESVVDRRCGRFLYPPARARLVLTEYAIYDTNV